MISWLRFIAYPPFDCEDCISMKLHGCYCHAIGAMAPSTPPTWKNLTARWILKKLGNYF